MKRLTQIALVGVLLLAVVSIAVAQPAAPPQQALQPVVRLGNFTEVANDLFMHIIATSDIRYATNENLDFEKSVRDRVTSRTPNSTAQQVVGDNTWAEVRLGVDVRYQKSLTFQLLFEQQHIFDGNLIDGQANNDNPGGTDVFGRDAEEEGGGLHVERYWIRYKFPTTPVTLFVGAELKQVGTVGIFGNDDPGIGLEAEFGALQVSAKAYMEREAQRLGLDNDNDLVSYAFTAEYDLKPHRFGVDVVWFRDRFFGADTQAVGCGGRGGLGCTGQKSDSVWIDAGWTGQLGPVRGLLQGNLMLGTARGGSSGLPAGVQTERDYDIFAGSVVAYAEVDLGIVRPYVLFVYGSADGDPRDRKLSGFAVQPQDDSTQWATGILAHLDKTTAAGTRDVACPARFQGVPGRQNGVPGNPYAIGALVTQSSAGAGFHECYHSVANLWNARLGRRSHQGIVTTYSNPGTLLGFVGARTFPLKGHEITGWFGYRGMVNSDLLEAAFVQGVDPGFRGKIRKTLYYEAGGFWMWTLNPHFDIRFAGSILVNGDGGEDLARLADCDTRPARRDCVGENLALRGEARFRARF